MTKLEVTKYAAKAIVGTSTGFVVGNAIRAVVVPKNNLQKVELVIGAIAIGGVVSAKTEAWVEAKIDDAVDIWNKAKESTKNENS